MTDSRTQILARLRQHRTPFPDAPPPPERYLPVSVIDVTNEEALIARFTTEVDALKGTVTLCADVKAARKAMLTHIGTAERVMAWGEIPLTGWRQALSAKGISVVIPDVRGEDRVPRYADLESIAVGITGAAAAFATTGTIVLPTDAGQGRIPSLVPPTHIALLPRERLFPRLEEWLTAEGRETLQRSRSVAFISGASKTGDIEMEIIYGVHGPKHVHIVLY
ncbi:MAG TPA: LUD domain-containing protein [Aggregatilineales bacterium]|nr:LUD domain-containing protein [Anaerolineales bacterium]HRE46888.1 LUD domain-containing protein [Aggregatilineales bacterium]